MGSKSITVYRGDDIESLLVTMTDADGEAIDITNDDVYFTVKIAKTDADVDALIGPIKNGPNANARGTAHSNPTSGQTEFNVLNTETDLAEGTYYYDIQRVTAAGIVTTLLVDEFIVLEEVTDTI